MTKLHHIQQRTEEWHALKLGKLTGSRLKLLVQPTTCKPKANWKDALYTILSERMTGFAEEVPVNKYMEHGTEFEDEAKTAFLRHIGIPFEAEDDSPWQDIGFVTVGHLEHSGLSPDYICGEDPREALEVKCPTSKKHVQIMLTQQVPNEWIPQATAYFVFMPKLTTLHWCSYDFRVKERPLIHLKIYRKDWEERIKNLEESLLLFDEEVNKTIK